MARFAFVILLACVASSLALDRVALEPKQSTAIPAGWSVVGPADKTRSIALTFAIKLRNLDALEKLFWAVSDPTSSSYGHHLSMKTVDALTAPSSASLRAVTSWLVQHGVVPTTQCQATHGKGFFVCTMPVSTAERLLAVQFVDITHARWPVPIARATASYTVPASVAPHLDFVGNVHRLPSFKNAPKTLSTTADGKIGGDPVPVIGVTPNFLRGRYNLTKEDVGKSANNSQAVASFLNQWFNQEDLTEFFHQFGNRFTHRDKVDKFVGPDPGVSGTEAALDVEYIMSTGANISTWFWSTPGKREGQEPFLDWILLIANTSVVPPVHSASYGDDEDSLDVPYMTRLNTEFQKAGVRGITIMFASGDDGAGCADSNNKFVPNFPASSPYVTAVGGTLFSDLGKEEDGNYISGGGFSNVFDIPDYQASAVQQFFSTATRLPDQKFYNKTGRGYPDVAAASNGFWVIVNRLPEPVAGTSCAAPSFSGIVSMLNEVRLAAGKSTLGFLNPFLYQNGAKLMYDVTKGCNAGCGSSQTGFCSQVGWDPVTGMGSPDFSRLKQAVLAM